MDIVSSTNPSVYFDNCLIGAIAKGDHPEEVAAIAALLDAAEKGTIRCVASTEVLGEIQKIPDRYREPHLAVWRQLDRLPALPIKWLDPASTSMGSTDADYDALQQVLPDEGDRRHVLYAVRYRTEFFATVDHRTVLAHKAELQSRFSVTAATPRELIGLLGIRTTSSG